MKKAIWTPTYETCMALKIKRGIDPKPIEVNIIKSANVIEGGVLRLDWCVINYKGVEYVVPARTLDYPR